MITVRELEIEKKRTPLNRVLRQRKLTYEFEWATKMNWQTCMHRMQWEKQITRTLKSNSHTMGDKMRNETVFRAHVLHQHFVIAHRYLEWFNEHRLVAVIINNNVDLSRLFFNSSFVNSCGYNNSDRRRNEFLFAFLAYSVCVQLYLKEKSVFFEESERNNPQQRISAWNTFENRQTTCELCKKCK